MKNQIKRNTIIAVAAAISLAAVAGCSLQSNDNLGGRDRTPEEQARLAKAVAELEEAEAKAEADAEEERKLKDAEEIKLKLDGWFKAAEGIYARWCTQTCDNSGVIGDGSYTLLEVWAKDRAAGDIYAKVQSIKE